MWLRRPNTIWNRFCFSTLNWDCCSWGQLCPRSAFLFTFPTELKLRWAQQLSSSLRSSHRPSRRASSQFYLSPFRRRECLPLFGSPVGTPGWTGLSNGLHRLFFRKAAAALPKICSAFSRIRFVWENHTLPQKVTLRKLCLPFSSSKLEPGLGTASDSFSFGEALGGLRSTHSLLRRCSTIVHWLFSFATKILNPIALLHFQDSFANFPPHRW